MRTRIRGRFLIGFDQETNDHVIYENGELVYEGDSIIFTGHHYPGRVDKEIDAGNSVISPGFIDLNALSDIDNTVIDFDIQGPGAAVSERYMHKGSRDIWSPKEMDTKTLYAFSQLISNGITTAMAVTGLQYRKWAESKQEYLNIAAIADDLGIRVYLGPSYRSGINIIKNDGSRDIFWDEEKGIDGLKENVSFIHELNSLDNDLIKGVLIPSTIETCTKELLQQTKEYSEELEVPIRLHATQSEYEFTLIKSKYGKTPIQFLNDIGFLGKRTLIPHAIYVNGYSRLDCGDGPDLELLRDSETIVVHCPFAAARSGTAMESFGRYKKMGIRMALGTDCYPPDMLLNIMIGSIMNRFVDNNREAASTADLYRTATLGGADALGRSDLGKLSPGCKADIIIINLDAFHIGQIDDPIRTITLNARGSDITDVIINGKEVMRNRSIQGVDLSSLHMESQGLFAKYKQSYSERDYLERQIDVMFPPSFPVKKSTGK